MACEIINKTIDGIEYTTIQFPARSGLKIKGRLLKIVGPVIGSSSTMSGGEPTVDFDISSLICKLDIDEFINLSLAILSFTKRAVKDISEDSFDKDFAGDYPHLYKVLWFVIQANHFFGKGDIAKFLKKFLKKDTEKETVSPE